MKRAVLYVVVTMLICFSFNVPAVAQDTQGSYSLPPGHVIPGRPWSSIIPDPDRFDWTARDGGRPGYRYRGMLPMQQRFYDYIQQQRRANIPLSWAEQATIRWLISSRRWPEAPRPNAFWSAFMRYLRDQPTRNLNIAQSIMLDQLRSRGLVPVDRAPDPNFARIRDYLNSGPFHSRNWFERVFGRAEPWMDNLYAGWGYDLRPSAPSGNSFPAGDPFNGLKITYNVSGATLSAPVDSGSFTINRSFKGVLGTGMLAISGTVRVGGYGADVSLSVWAGDKKEEKKFYVENKGSNGNPQNFNLSVPIPGGARTGGFAIRLDGRYSMGGGHRGCYVTGEFGPSQAQIDADRAAADAKWRREVEDTLARLGYQNTPEGKEIEEMRKALAGGDAAWKAFVDDRLERMRGDDSPEIAEYKELENAMTAGGAEWDKYVAAHGTSGSTGSRGNAVAASSLIKQGRDYYEKNKYNEAADAFTKAIEANPDSAEAYTGRGNARRSLRDYAAASADFNKAIALDARASEAYRGRSMVKRAQNDFSGALADANRAIDLAPNFDRGYLTRGLAREGLKDLAGALSDYNRAISLDPSYAMSHYYRGRVLFESKDYARAIPDFNRAISLDPSYAMSYFQRGRARYASKDYDGALADYNRYIEMNATDSAAFNNRGLVKERLGDKNGAIADYEKAVSINPQNEIAKGNLSRLRATSTATNPSGYPDVAGEWVEVSGYPSNGSPITITQSGANIVAVGRYTIGNTAIAYRVDGTLTRDGVITGRLVHTKGVSPGSPGFAQDRRMTLTPDGNTLNISTASVGGGGAHQLSWRRRDPTSTKTTPP
ncbi:MAG TPA: tetratricopeptide repeat protein [Blastocatellia bacterium]|nr:tetratricopeptide repeat protein [Blastocatellia bacterium]